jgi:hypothetical protein
MQQGNFIDVFSALHVSEAYVGRVYGADTVSAPYTRPTQRLPRPPSIHNLGAENHMLQLNI